MRAWGGGDLISTKLPIVNDLSEIFIHTSIDELEQREDGSTHRTPIHEKDPA
jgi:hypothetical protein